MVKGGMRVDLGKRSLWQRGEGVQCDAWHNLQQSLVRAYCALGWWPGREAMCVHLCDALFRVRQGWMKTRGHMACSKPPGNG